MPGSFLAITVIKLSKSVNRKQASKFIRQNNIMTILIRDFNNTMAGYQKEVLYQAGRLYQARRRQKRNMLQIVAASSTAC